MKKLRITLCVVAGLVVLAMVVNAVTASSAPGSAVSVSTASSLRGGADTCAKIKPFTCATVGSCKSKQVWQNGSGDDQSRCLSIKSECGCEHGDCTDFYSGGVSCSS